MIIQTTSACNTMYQFLWYILFCSITTSNATTIIPTSNEVLFKPLGQLIPELSWGTVRIHVNMSDIFTEINYICKASRLIDTGTNVSEWN